MKSGAYPEELFVSSLGSVLGVAGHGIKEVLRD